MQVNIVNLFQTLTTDIFIIYRVFVKLHVHRYWTQLMPIIWLLLTREPGNIFHRKNLSITADSSAVFYLILWIHSLEFQTHCLAVVNCLIFCEFLQLATSARLQFTVSAAFPGATFCSQRMARLILFFTSSITSLDIFDV